MPNCYDNFSEPRLSFADLHREAAGVLQLHLIDPPLGRQIFEAAADGDGLAFRLASGVLQSLHRIQAAPAGEPMLCMTCPAALCADDALTFILATSAVDRPSIAMGAALCPTCGGRPDRHEQVTVALRRLWPDLRPIQISEAVGHA